ncbi:MAG: DNA-methyltransferase [Candidatus Helarchaeales archaeon]
MDEIPSESVQLIVTSPPYWDVRHYGGKGLGHGQAYEEYVESMNEVWKECIRVLKKNGKIAVNFQPLPLSAERSGFKRRAILNIMFDVEKFMRQHGLFLCSMHYWDKAEYINNVYWGSYPNPTNIGSNTSFEQIFVWVKPGPTRKIPPEILEKNALTKEEWRHWAVRCIWDDIAPVIKIDSTGKNRFGHSAPFPEDIPYRCIKMHTVEGETVLDPFLGSGTTLKICRLLNRHGIGYEINEEYEQIIKTRIMESWIPPRIEPQYKVIGSETLSEILDLTMINALNECWMINKNLSKHNFLNILRKKCLEALQKEFPSIFTKSYLKKIQEGMDKQKREKNKDLFSFL